MGNQYYIESIAGFFTGCRNDAGQPIFSVNSQAGKVFNQAVVDHQISLGYWDGCEKVLITEGEKH